MVQYMASLCVSMVFKVRTLCVTVQLFEIFFCVHVFSLFEHADQFHMFSNCFLCFKQFKHMRCFLKGFFDCFNFYVDLQ